MECFNNVLNIKQLRAVRERLMLFDISSSETHDEIDSLLWRCSNRRSRFMRYGSVLLAVCYDLTLLFAD
ncbi:hypothetical protein T11_5660 [Trichinella zimbabwensis]|uniref:Uncharacterized protein n=1 Tax=Trichinella zimbabwensis TaxID=268475 RepID=A0A0V1HD03_9BILA|nr:hypothetical protein T11_5660 [Trichinella zimbabwensis]